MSQQVMTPTTDLNSPMTLIPNFTSNEFTTDEQLSLISRIAVASIGSQGTVGGLIITGIVRNFNFSSIFNFN
jgi:mitofusin 2